MIDDNYDNCLDVYFQNNFVSPIFYNMNKNNISLINEFQGFDNFLNELHYM